jgi:DNA-binding CsgD family transcriptional regulator
MQRGYFETSKGSLEKARALFRERDDTMGEVLAMTQLAGTRAEISDVEYLTSYERVRQHNLELPPELQFFWLLGVLWNSAHNYRLERVEQLLEELVTEAIAHDQINTYRTLAQSIGHPLFFSSKGKAPFLHLVSHMQPYAEQGDRLVQMGICNIQGMVAVFDGDVNSAQQQLRQSLTILQSLGGIAWMDMVVDMMLLNSFLLQEDLASFDDYYRQRVQHTARQDGGGGLMAEFLYLRGRRLLLEDIVDELPHIIDDIAQHTSFREHAAMQVDLQVRLAWRAGDLSQAERLAQQSLRIQAEAQRYHLLFTPVTLALIHWEMGERDLALREFKQAAQRLVDWDYRGILLFEGRALVPLLEYALKANVYPELCRFCIEFWNKGDQTRPIEIPNSTEVLTIREVEILREIVAGASNRDIAATLVISENTVKSHITRILAKLDAKSRTEAVARMHELGLRL